jgi:hypothetical protein
METCQGIGGEINVASNSQTSNTSWFVRLREWWWNLDDWLRGFFYGMTFFEMEKELRKQRADLEHLFVLISFGDLLGLPILPPYYSMRLLPFIVPMLESWRRRMLRERDLIDLVG